MYFLCSFDLYFYERIIYVTKMSTGVFCPKGIKTGIFIFVNSDIATDSPIFPIERVLLYVISLILNYPLLINFYNTRGGNRTHGNCFIRTAPSPLGYSRLFIKTAFAVIT